jgi:integrase
MPKRHKLGFGNGTIVEYEDGTAGYIPTMSLTQAFRVKISDVTGFSVTKGHKMLERQINVLGNGTLLGAASVNHGTSEAIENFRDRGFVQALEEAGLAEKGITIHGLRSAAISLYAARGLSMLETATIMGQADPGVTWKHYARLFDRSDVEARVRAAQASLGA